MFTVKKKNVHLIPPFHTHTNITLHKWKYIDAEDFLKRGGGEPEIQV